MSPPQVERYRAPEGLRNEEAHFDRFCQGAPGSRSMVLWTQSQCLVTSSLVARNPRFPQAARQSAERGWAVHVRRSGGTTVFHSAAVLCVTLMFDSVSAVPVIDAAYSGLIDVLVPALTDVGVNATIGPAPGAPCDGRFNVLVDGRKLAGTAVRVRSIGARHCILAHAAIIVDEGYAECLAAIEGFESDLGLCSAYRQDACIGAREIMDPSRRGAPLESLAATLVRRSQMQSV